MTDWGLLRRFITEGGSTYARIVLGLRVKDLTGGFKCFRREVLEAIHFDGVRSHGYAFQVELTYRAVRAGFEVVEVPIVFNDRQRGESKMSWRIAAEAMWLVPQLRFSRAHGAGTRPSALRSARVTAPVSGSRPMRGGCLCRRVRLRRAPDAARRCAPGSGRRAACWGAGSPARRSPPSACWAPMWVVATLFDGLSVRSLDPAAAVRGRRRRRRAQHPAANLLVLALHAMACVAGFIAGCSLPLQAEHHHGVSRWSTSTAGGSRSASWSPPRPSR